MHAKAAPIWGGVRDFFEGEGGGVIFLMGLEEVQI